MKVIIVGSTHAGTAAAKNIRSLHPNAEITVYEKNDNVSFLSCGIALYVGGVVKDAQGLFYSSPEEMAQEKIHINMLHEVMEVRSDKKEVDVKNLTTGEVFTDTYDKLVMTTGSWPIVPNIEGIQQDNILLSKNYGHAQTIIEKAKDAEKIAVIGAGYIGVELVEAFQQYGKDVTLIDASDRILNKYLDKEFTDPVETEFKNRGVNLALEQTVKKFEGNDGKVKKVITDKGSFDVDLVVLCVGFKPNTFLLDGQVEMMPNGAIIVDEYMRTSNEDILAAGDSCAIHYNPTGQSQYIPLATNAVRMGTLVARNLVSKTIRYMGTQGTSGLHLYELSMASTGLTATSAAAQGIEVEHVIVRETDRPGFMPTTEDVLFKLTFDPKTRVILGAQVISKADMTQSINTMSVAIQNKMTVEELGFVDFFFQPHFNKPWNLLNQAALAAL